jgi:hypothetical protein
MRRYKTKHKLGGDVFAVVYRVPILSYPSPPLPHPHALFLLLGAVLHFSQSTPPLLARMFVSSCKTSRHFFVAVSSPPFVLETSSSRTRATASCGGRASLPREINLSLRFLVARWSVLCCAREWLQE